MRIDWSEFQTKVTNWAEKETNELSFKFTVKFFDEHMLIISEKNNKIQKIKYSKEKYYKDRNKFSDKDIIPILFQILKEKYKTEVKWSVTGAGRRKKYAG